MRVLVACEFSGIVRDAFIAMGHDAVSCDILPSERPGPHIEGNVLRYLADGWDLMVAHPPCHYLARSGARWWAGLGAEQEHALAFVLALMGAPIARIAVENPPGKIGTAIMPADQYIQPWQYGHSETKMTGLWLKNLSALMPTQIMTTRSDNLTPSGQNKIGPSPDRWRERSRTYPGIAAAMAAQWGA